MKNKKNLKTLSTIWLDFVGFIFMPFYILVLSMESIKMIGSKKYLLLSLLIIGMLYSVLTFYNFCKRNKLGYYLMYPFYTISIVSIILYFSNKVNITNIIYILEFIAVGFAFWVVPNCMYIYKRKDIFRKHNVAHIKKCPGCNRIIPVHMKSCGRCNYKER